jgi:hypothetical protein
MSHKTKRELERALADLEDAPGTGKKLLVARRDPKTGELTEASTGEPVDPTDHGAEQLVVIERSVVMDREEAEQAGCEVLGPAKDVPPGRDVVRIVWDDAARKHTRKKYGR